MSDDLRLARAAIPVAAILAMPMFGCARNRLHGSQLRGGLAWQWGNAGAYLSSFGG